MPTPRRAGATISKDITITEEGRDLIASWATEHGMSFSGAIESLARLGLGQAMDVALAPAIVSVIRREVATHQERFINLLLFAITEAGTAARMASAAVKFQRQDQPGVYEKILEKAQTAARRTLGRGKVAAIVQEVMAYGDSEGELPGAAERQGG